MGLMTAVGVALAGTQIIGGIAASREAKYNASTLYQQAGMIEDQKKLQATQDDRAIRMIMGKTVAVTAGKGIELSGSPMAIMIDTRTQLEMDKAIGQYNLEVQKRYTISQAEAYKRQGKTAMIGGITSGLTTLFQTAATQASFKAAPKYASTPFGAKTLVAPSDYYLTARTP